MIWGAVGLLVLVGAILATRGTLAPQGNALNEGRLKNLAGRTYDGDGELTRLPDGDGPLEARLAGQVRGTPVQVLVERPFGASSEQMTALFATDKPLLDFPLGGLHQTDHPDWPSRISGVVSDFLVQQMLHEGLRVHVERGQFQLMAELNDANSHGIWLALYRGAALALLLEAECTRNPTGLRTIIADKRNALDVVCVAARRLAVMDAKGAKSMLSELPIPVQLAMLRGLKRPPQGLLLHILRTGHAAEHRLAALELLRDSDAFAPDASIRERLLRELHTMVKTSSGTVLAAVVDRLVAEAETLPRKLLQQRFLSVGAEPRAAITRAMAVQPRENVTWALRLLEKEQGGTMLALALCGLVVELGGREDVVPLESLAVGRTPEFRARVGALRERVGGATSHGGLVLVDDDGRSEGALSLGVTEGGELAVAP